MCFSPEFGIITVYSKPGKGSTFNVFFPRIEHVEAAEETEIRLGKIPTGKEHILFVDDEPAIVDIAKGMLEHLGYKVEARTSPMEALAAFKVLSGKFDLIVSDMTMPKMTGDELARELMAIRPDIPIILCTGFSEHITEEKAKAIGIQKFVMKPFIMREMAEAIRQVLDS
ncbi:MAG: response regulator [Deltaproteobacteria bacterium]|nr:response regulator [Deltaproteobacteria bacterium]